MARMAVSPPGLHRTNRASLLQTYKGAVRAAVGKGRDDLPRAFAHEFGFGVEIEMPFAARSIRQRN